MDAADAAALAALAARYAARVDARDTAGAAALFTADADLVLPDPPADLGPVRRVRGRAAIAAALDLPGSLLLTFHALAGHTADAGPGPDTASGRTACVAHHLSHTGSGTADLVWHLHYADDYRREDGTWLFRRRRLYIDFIATAPVRRWRPPDQQEQR
ncbi:nuclear transport factor 2 family protein [Nocardiopsis coralliicola]